MSLSLLSLTNRGYTGHEHLPVFNIINMNGRVYDPVVGRFMSPDNYIQAPTNTQSFNRYSYVWNNPLKYTDPTGWVVDDYFINKDGSIATLKTDDSFDRFFTQNNDGSYSFEAQLEKNEYGLVKFPDSGDGFERYGTIDIGGDSKTPFELVGCEDHYLKPIATAALFGVINELRDQGFHISLGDMSSSNGSDPWQSGNKHHAGHGHNGKQSGLNVDFRYLNCDGVSFQSPTATTDSQFSKENNQEVFDVARKFGFTKNYQGTGSDLENVKNVSGHNDHGHLGLNKVNWQYVSSPPTNVATSFSNLFKIFKR